MDISLIREKEDITQAISLTMNGQVKAKSTASLSQARTELVYFLCLYFTSNYPLTANQADFCYAPIDIL